MGEIQMSVPAALRDRRFTPDEIVEAVLDETGPTPQVELSYEPDIQALWATIRPEPKPVFTLQLLDSLNKVQRGIHRLFGGENRYRFSPVRFFACRGVGPVLTLGGDLDFYLDCIATGDRAGFEEYARLSVEGAAWNASGLEGTAITVAMIHGKAVGGGIDAGASCQVMVAEEQASFVYPEVRFNHFPITGVAVLSRRMGPLAAQRVLMSGEEYSAQRFYEAGALDAVAPTGGGEAWVRAYCAETLPMHGARMALFSGFHRRAGDMREEMRHMAGLWVDCMMRLTPLEISRLQRVARAQERMLTRMY
jgi:DSF synthase